MKKTYLISSFLVVSASAIGASAVLSFNGSDTLFTISTDVVNGADDGVVLPDFPGGRPAGITAIPSISYIGGGSGTGENAMVAGTQQVAPMSRFLGNAKVDQPVCTGASASPTTSEGIVIGLDGVALVANDATAASVACNGNQSDTSKDTTLGLVRTKGKSISWPDGSYTSYGKSTVTYAAGSYTITDWTDVIRILFAGMTFTAGSTASAQNCAAPVRAALINNWGLMFEKQGCASGTCTSIKHGFRRDDFSGTTDTVVGLLNLPSIPSSHLTDPFCNSIPDANMASRANLPVWMQNKTLPTFQELDPIRTACAPTDVVCNADGTIGWELVIEPTDIPAGSAYPNSSGTSVMGAGVGGKLSATGNNYYCPNGDIAVLIDKCLFPVDGSGNFQNTASAGSRPIYTFGGVNFHAATDGRIYNTFNHTTAGAAIFAANGFPFQGSWFRAYQSQCQLVDATQQIGCFIGTAEPCSIGYAGRGAIAQTNADSMRVDGIMPASSNVQSFAYPLSRKLYLDTLKGFEHVSDSPNAELTFAKNEANKLEIGYYVEANGFVMLPNTVTVGGSAGAPFCEDFNEKMLCSAFASATNSDACGGVGFANPAGIPTTGTTCGNGDLITPPEIYERCDSGAAVNGTASSNCSRNCNCLSGGVDINGHCCLQGTGSSQVDCCAPGATCTPGIGI